MGSVDLAHHFKEIFGVEPKIFAAPGRVNLIGEHTDYNDGFVMPSAIGYKVRAAIAPRSDRKLLMRSKEFPQQYEFDLDKLPDQRVGAWCDYVLGITVVLKQAGYPVQGANLLIQGDVPIGAG